MLFVNETQFAKIMEKGDKALANAYVYVLSNDSRLGEGDNNFKSLVPPSEKIKAVVNGDLSQDQFLDDYKESLKTYENSFILYSIARAFNERKFMPIFVCTDEEYELGYMKVLRKYLSKKYGMKAIKPKQYLKAIKVVSKEVKQLKKEGVKRSKREKAFIKGMRDFVRDVCQINLKGLEKLEKADQKFAIDRIVMLINNADDPMEEISKKSVIAAINSFAQSKKGKKMVKRHVKEIGISKKQDRWSRKDAIALVMSIYNEIHNIEEESDDN